MEQALRRFKGAFDYRLAEGLGINPSVWLESEWNAALEVKTTDADSISGMKEFKAKYPRAKTCLVGGQGLPLEEFFHHSAIDFL